MKTPRSEFPSISPVAFDAEITVADELPSFRSGLPKKLMAGAGLFVFALLATVGSRTAMSAGRAMGAQNVTASIAAAAPAPAPVAVTETPSLSTSHASLRPLTPTELFPPTAATQVEFKMTREEYKRDRARLTAEIASQRSASRASAGTGSRRSASVDEVVRGERLRGDRQ